MATVLVTALRGSGKAINGGADCIATFFFYGIDVPDSLEGQPQEETVRLPANYTLATFKNTIVAAVQSKAEELDLVVANNDIDLPSYDSGSGA